MAQNDRFYSPVRKNAMHFSLSACKNSLFIYHLFIIIYYYVCPELGLVK